uniref:Uncharacterized protein n=1 Tax=Arundo donax TaxID=35708 RepID=A0A0A8YEF1_ARUDO
MPLSLTCIPCI